MLKLNVQIRHSKMTKQISIYANFSAILCGYDMMANA